MDLENELRQAMADDVEDVSAPRSLASDVRRRHRRRVRRRGVAVGAAAGIVAVVAAVPTFQAIHPREVGAHSPDPHHTGPGTASTRQLPASPPDRSPKPSDTPETPHHPARPPATSHTSAHSTPPRSWLSYLPTGIRPDASCHTQHATAKSTTTCRWTGPAGWIELRLVHADGLTGPSDLGFTPPMPTSSRVHGHPALRSAIPATVMWAERKGVGVWIGVAPSLSSTLLHIAEGAHIP